MAIYRALTLPGPALGEASGPKFKAFSAVVKGELNHTRGSVSKLVPYKSAI